MKNREIFLFLALILWLASSHIGNYFFPTNSDKDINGYWELKKIIYSIGYVLIILAGEYKKQINKLIALIFIGFLSEDISDRLQGITYFQYSDFIVMDLVVLSSIYIIYKNDINDKINNSNYFNCNRG